MGKHTETNEEIREKIDYLKDDNMSCRNAMLLPGVTEDERAEYRNRIQANNIEIHTWRAVLTSRREKGACA